MNKEVFSNPEIEINVFSNSDKILTLSSNIEDDIPPIGGKPPIQLPND